MTTPTEDLIFAEEIQRDLDLRRVGSTENAADLLGRPMMLPVDEEATGDE